MFSLWSALRSSQLVLLDTLDALMNLYYLNGCVSVGPCIHVQVDSELQVPALRCRSAGRSSIDLRESHIWKDSAGDSASVASVFYLLPLDATNGRYLESCPVGSICAKTAKSLGPHV